MEQGATARADERPRRGDGDAAALSFEEAIVLSEAFAASSPAFDRHGLAMWPRTSLPRWGEISEGEEISEAGAAGAAHPRPEVPLGKARARPHRGEPRLRLGKHLRRTAGAPRGLLAPGDASKGASEPGLVRRRSGERTACIGGADGKSPAQRTADADAQRRAQVCVRKLVPGGPHLHDAVIAAAQGTLLCDSKRTSRRTMRRNTSSCGSSSAPSTIFSVHQTRYSAGQKAIGDLYVPNWVETLMCCGMVMIPFLLLGMLVAPLLVETELCM